MAWVAITNNPEWEYDNAPPAPTIGTPQYDLWLKSALGIRIQPDGTEIYISTRRIGTHLPSGGELNKSYWDAR